ncbi:unnamed protein product, partial [marine sediment metagenome]
IIFCVSRPVGQATKGSAEFTRTSKEEDSTLTGLSVSHQLSKEREAVTYHHFWAFAMASKF